MSTVTAHTLLHIGIPVNDPVRARDFYVDVLGLKVSREPDGPDAPLVRLYCGDSPTPGQQVVLFKRPQPLQRDAVAQDGHTHHAFVVAPEEFDVALERFQELGILHSGPIIRGERDGHPHRTLYFFDPDGNYLQLGDSAEE
jgi:catechol 2,3-dioxygenase-like lactoylglutathione lyase family enzyme